MHGELTIAEMRYLAEKQGGGCLSEKYVNAATKLLWQCSEGHQWKATPTNIKRGRWCPYCFQNRWLLTIEEMQLVAAKRGGRCLSEEYVNTTTKLSWQCSEGHQWEATPDNIRKGSWCPECYYNKRKLTIEKMQNMAEDKGGRCLSKKYVNAATKLLWQCHEGHTWKATPANIKSGRWCPICVGRKVYPDIEEIPLVQTVSFSP